MSTKPDKVKQLQDKCQSVLNELLRDDDNKYCVDCDSKGPRWASWNLGVFLCIRCAGIHRNLGVHISKVKSVNLDSWTPEQVVSLQQMGNSRARAVYEANLPDNFRRPQSDSSLETFIRAKYEQKKYIAREWVPPTLPKVNWEKEIDDELEKQKRKKKTVVEKKPSNPVEVPTLPKPKNPSPKPGRITQTNQNQNEETKQSDLLGLQNGEDNFSGFLSAPSKKPEEKSEEDVAKTEEESFFNQTAPLEKEKVKLTKDSILALYGNTPNNFNNIYQPQVNPYQQPPYQNFSAFPQQNYPLQNGIPQYPVQYPQQQPQQWTPNAQYVQNPQYATQFPVVANQFPVNSQFMQPSAQIAGLNQFQQAGTTLGQAAPNPFYGTQGLQQQFGGLSLGNATPANGAPTVATNLWQ